MNNKIKFVACTGIAVGVVGVTIFEAIREDKIARKKEALRQEEQAAAFSDLVLNLKAFFVAYNHVDRPIEEGIYDDSGEMTESFKERLEFEKIALRFDS